MKRFFLLCLFLLISLLRIGIAHSSVPVDLAKSEPFITPLYISVPYDSNAVGEKNESIVLLRIFEKQLFNTPHSLIGFILETQYFIKGSIVRARIQTQIGQALFCQFLL